MVRTDETTDKSGWVWIVAPDKLLSGVHPPLGDWKLSQGPTGEEFNSTRPGAAPAGDAPPGGKEKKQTPPKTGGKRKANFDGPLA
eukprot:3208895-Prymnesium_polylepis.1